MRLGAALLEALPDDIEIAQGQIYIKGSPDRGMRLGELARTVLYRSDQLPSGVEPSIEATQHYANPDCLGLHQWGASGLR